MIFKMIWGSVGFMVLQDFISCRSDNLNCLHTDKKKCYQFLKKILYKMKILILILCCYFVLSSCNSDSSNLSVDMVKYYNQKIESGYENNDHWVTSPLSIAIELSEAGEVSEKTTIFFRKINKGEVATEVAISIKEIGLLDDSNTNGECFFYMKKVNGKWKIMQ